MRSFDELKADVLELRVGQKNLESAVGVIVETLKDHKQAIEMLAGQMNTLTVQMNNQAGQINTLTDQMNILTGQVKDQATLITSLTSGQAQILTILTGKTQRND